MSELLEKIRSRGHWQVRIMPAQFNEELIPDVAELERILDRTFVRFRGWEFPHLGSNPLVHCKDESSNGWIGQETDWCHYVELWRFYQSGQFIYYSGIKEDWQNQCQLPCLYGGIEPGEALDVLDTLLRFSEIFEFASLLTFPPSGDGRISLEITISGLQGRALWDKPGGLYAPENHQCYKEKYRYQQVFSFIDLANAKEPALAAARELFRQFGWNPSINRLREMQTELLRKSSTVGR